MNRPFWSFLLDLGPIDRALHRKFRREVEPVLRSAEDTVARARVRFRNTLHEHEQRNTELSRHNEELRERVAELEATSQELRKELVAERHAGKNQQRAYEAEKQRRREEAAALDQDTTSDLFCCLKCESLWLLSMPSGHRCEVRRPVGDGCDICNAKPLLWVMEVRTSGAKSAGVASKAARPSPTVPDPMILPIPGDRDARIDLGVRLGKKIQDDETVPALAGELARDRSDPIMPVQGCATLDAIATGLERIPREFRKGFVWCATELVGPPETLTKILGELVTRAAVPSLPIDDIARGVRLIGLVSCAADNRLGTCPCASHLVKRDDLRTMVDELLDIPAPVNRPWFDPFGDGP